MAIPGFFDENADRAYPFVDGQSFDGVTGAGLTYTLKKEIVLDFSCQFGARVGPALPDVYLTKIYRLGNIVELTFTTSALPDHQLVFSFDQADREFTAETSTATTDSPDSVCDDEYAWSGTLVVGRLESLFENLPSPTTWIPDASPGILLEPGVIILRHKHYVDSVTVGNFDRTRYEPPASCSMSSSSAATTPGDVIIDSTCLRGDLVFREGYNCSLRVSEIDNSLTIAAAVGAGAGEPCEEVPLYDGEQPPDNSPFLSGGDACRDIIASINGLTAEQIFIATSPGLEAVQTGEHELTIRFTGDGINIIEAT